MNTHDQYLEEWEQAFLDNVRWFGLRHVFTPYHRILKEERGWQFGVPSPNPKKPLGFRLLAENGDLYELEDPTLTSPINGAAPQPSWAWVPTRLDGDLFYVSIRSPDKGRGSFPLTRLKEQNVETFEAPGGRDALFDLQEDIRVERDDGWYIIQLGLTRIMGVEVYDEKLLQIYPMEPAYKAELWTTHLAQMVRMFRNLMHPA